MKKTELGKKIGWSSDEFIKNVEKTGKFSIDVVTGIDVRKVLGILMESGTKTEFVNRLKDEGLNEFAIGFALCESGRIIEKSAETIGKFMKTMAGEKEKTAEQKLTYIE